MLRDDDAFPVAVSAMMGHVQEDDLRINANDDFDDVFGSAPSSPSFSPSNLEQPDEDILTSLDDSSYGDRRTRVGNLEVSDIPRLKEKHETEGYRDGVTAGKATVVQAGFDEGYGLGAVLGLRIGAILGMLEGLTSAVTVATKTEESEESKVWAEEKDRLQNLLAKARNELRTESVFGKDWWGVDGLWTYEVPGEGKEGAEVIFPDVASAHPLVKKWESVVADEVLRWELDLKVMEGEDTNDVGGRKAQNNKEQPLETLVGEGMVMGTPKSALIW